MGSVTVTRWGRRTEEAKESEGERGVDSQPRQRRKRRRESGAAVYTIDVLERGRTGLMRRTAGGRVAER